MDLFRSSKCGKCATTPLFDRLARPATEPKVILQSPSALAKSSATRRMRVLGTSPDNDRPQLVLYKSSSHCRRGKIRRQATPPVWYAVHHLGRLLISILFVDS